MLYYNIIILWDHLRICGSSLAETSLCFAYLYIQEKQWTCKCKIKARSLNHCCRGKAISIVNAERVTLELFIQNSKRMRRVILSSVACLVLP